MIDDEIVQEAQQTQKEETFERLLAQCCCLFKERRTNKQVSGRRAKKCKEKEVKLGLGVVFPSFRLPEALLKMSKHGESSLKRALKRAHERRITPAHA